MAKRIILWTAPRSVSNAFLCSISTLKNTKHFHELFSGVYYFGPGVIGMRVSPGIVFPAHISLGMRVSPHIYH